MASHRTPLSTELKRHRATPRLLAVGVAVFLLLVPTFGLPVAAATPAPSFSWGSDLSPWWSYDNAQRGAAMSASTAARMTIFYSDAKDGNGQAAWATPSYTTLTAFAPGDGALERAVRDAHAKGLQVGARFDVFQDGVAAAKFPRASLGGSPAWVDPACADVRGYLLGMLKDMVTRVPVDEVNLDHIRYPFTDEVSAGKSLPCTGGTLGSPGSDRSAIVASFVKDAAAVARAARPGVRVSASIFPEAVMGPHPIIGQDAARMAPSLDHLKPMLYPGYWLGSVSAPYQPVYDHARTAVQKFGSAKVQPWVQGFDAHAGNVARVCDQVKAARAAGASGVAVWWFPTMGFSQTMWKSIGDCAVGTGTAAPAPTTGAFTASFSTGGGNEWWITVNVQASQALAGVDARVNGGTWKPLTLQSWGAWAASYYAPAGSTVEFRARSTTGSELVSGAYAWPSGAPASSGGSGSSGGIAATFKNVRGNGWWIQTEVAVSGGTLAGVDARVNGGAWIPLEKQKWGAWAKSMRAPDGSTVELRARATSGAVSPSTCYRWTSATPIACAA